MISQDMRLGNHSLRPANVNAPILLDGGALRCSRPKPSRLKGSAFHTTLYHIAFWALTLMPGPMVEAVTQLRMYWPLAAAGLAFTMAPISAS